jgi:hypothetical protein
MKYKIAEYEPGKFWVYSEGFFRQDAWRIIQSSRNDFPQIEFSDHQVRTGTSRLKGTSI